MLTITLQRHQFTVKDKGKKVKFVPSSPGKLSKLLLPKKTQRKSKIRKQVYKTIRSRHNDETKYDMRRPS